MSRSIFTYSPMCADFFRTPSAELPYYCVFAIYHISDPDTPLHEIITNASGCGRWVYDGAEYGQVRGTAQYSIPRTTQGIRRALRRELREILSERAERGEATDEERQILDVLGGCIPHDTERD